MTAVLEAPTAAQEIAPEEEMKDAGIPRKRWTRDEYRRLTENGFLQDGKVELINGEIWEKMGHGRRHIAACTRLSAALGKIVDPLRLQSQASLPVTVSGDPEPDMAILAGVMDDYLERDPTVEDALLIVEISDSTLRADLTVKQIMYAQSGIPEYWVVDIPHRLLHVFRNPAEGGYTNVTVLSPRDEVRPLAAPDSAVRVANLLP